MSGRLAIPNTALRLIGAIHGLWCFAVWTSPTLAEALPVAPATSIAAASAEPHPLDPVLSAARDSLQHIEKHVRDYTAIMTKRCRVNGVLTDYQQAFVKIRSRRQGNGQLAVPMSVYMKFRYPAAIRGREVIWIEGRNGGKMVAHDVGIKGLIRVSLDPNSALAMRGQRYPITEIGLENLVRKMIEKGQQDRQYGECKATRFDTAEFGKRPCHAFRIEHPVRRPHFDFYRAEVFFDSELRMPVRYASWSWPTEPGGKPLLEEEYNYTDIRVNVGLADLDFNVDNPDYDF